MIPFLTTFNHKKRFPRVSSMAITILYSHLRLYYSLQPLFHYSRVILEKLWTCKLHAIVDSPNQDFYYGHCILAAVANPFPNSSKVKHKHW